MTGLMFYQNIFYCTVFVISGAIILRTLKKFDFQTAYCFSVAVFGALSLYIPFYFGGRLGVDMICRVVRNETFSFVYYNNMEKMLSAPFIFVQSITTGTAIIAAVAIAAVFAFAVSVAVRIIRYVCELHIIKESAAVFTAPRGIAPEIFVKNDRNIYKRLLRLRN